MENRLRLVPKRSVVAAGTVSDCCASSRNPQQGRSVLVLALFWLASTMSLWLLAFVSFPVETPSWLLQTQAVCFGVTEDGLPDLGGWLLLIGAPLMILVSMLIIFGTELRFELKSRIADRWFQLPLLLIVALIAGEAHWVGTRISNASASAVVDDSANPLIGPLPAGYPRTSIPAPNFQLLDQFGKTIKLEDFAGKTVFLTFAFAHCKAMCPAILRSLKQASAELNDAETAYLTVTLDPWRDTPAALAGFAVAWNLGTNSHLLTGAVDQVEAVLDAYHVPRKRDENNGDVVHPALVVLIDSQGKIAYTFNAAPAQWLVAAANNIKPPASAVSAARELPE